MNKKLLSFATASVLALSISATAFASSQGTVERSVNFRSAPSTSSTVYTTLKSGTTFDIIDQVNKYWYKISLNGKVGYVSANYISANSTSSSSPTTSGANTGTVERSVNFRSAPSTSSKVYRTLKPGTNFRVLDQVNAYWLHVSVDGQAGYVSANYVNFSSAPQPQPQPQPTPAPPASSSSKADKIIQHAEDLQGVTKYKFGVNQPPHTLDCSSFTKYVFGLEGVSLKWGTRYQKDAGSFVSRANLQKGDLVFFWTSSKGKINHVGIYMGNGKFIHNSPSMNGVGISTLTSGYWDTHYVTARRVL